MTRVRSSPSSAKRRSLQLLTFSLSAIRDLSSAIVLRSPHSAVRNSSSFILSSRFSSEKVSDRLSPDKLLTEGYNFAVSASEIIKEVPKLTDAERQAVLDKLRELAQVDDDLWEEIINERTPRPKLRAFIEQATAEGSEPLDLNRM